MKSSNFRYMSTLEWIIIYSHVPVAFHVITNTDSKPFVEKVKLISLHEMSLAC